MAASQSASLGQGINTLSLQAINPGDLTYTPPDPTTGQGASWSLSSNANGYQGGQYKISALNPDDASGIPTGLIRTGGNAQDGWTYGLDPKFDPNKANLGISYKSGNNMITQQLSRQADGSYLAQNQGASVGDMRGSTLMNYAPYLVGGLALGGAALGASGALGSAAAGATGTGTSAATGTLGSAITGGATTGAETGGLLGAGMGGLKGGFKGAIQGGLTGAAVGGLAGAVGGGVSGLTGSQAAGGFASQASKPFIGQGLSGMFPTANTQMTPGVQTTQPQGSGNTDWGSLISNALPGLINGAAGYSQNRTVGNTLQDMYTQQNNLVQPYVNQLSQSYSNPNSYLQSPEYQAISNIYGDNLLRQKNMAGTGSNPTDYGVKMQQFAMQNLSNYRQGLQQTINGMQTNARGYAPYMAGGVGASTNAPNALFGQTLFGQTGVNNLTSAMGTAGVNAILKQFGIGPNSSPQQIQQAMQYLQDNNIVPQSAGGPSSDMSNDQLSQMISGGYNPNQIVDPGMAQSFPVSSSVGGAFQDLSAPTSGTDDTLSWLMSGGV